MKLLRCVLTLESKIIVFGWTQSLLEIKSSKGIFELVVYIFPLLRQAGLEGHALRGSLHAIPIYLAAHIDVEEPLIGREVNAFNAHSEHVDRVALVCVEGGP
jgi:hypothetical protein